MKTILYLKIPMIENVKCLNLIIPIINYRKIEIDFIENRYCVYFSIIRKSALNLVFPKYQHEATHGVDKNSISSVPKHYNV